MMMAEFEKLTGIFPTDDLYREIEAAYYEFNGDKTAFCKAYKENRDGLAERVQFKAGEARRDREASTAAELKKAKAEVEALKKKLEREEEWQPYIDKDNYQQAEYDHLKSAGRVMSDDEAKDLLYDEFGFAREKVKIYHSIPTFEVNRHHALRRVASVERLPLYEATDWNYIRFDCGVMSYELVNDEIRPFVH